MRGLVVERWSFGEGTPCAHYYHYAGLCAETAWQRPVAVHAIVPSVYSHDMIENWGTEVSGVDQRSCKQS